MLNQYILLGLVFVTFSTVTLFFLSLISRRTTVSKRLRGVENQPAIENLKKELHQLKKRDREQLNPAIEKMITSLADTLHWGEPAKSKLHRSLLQAGFQSDLSMRTFISLKILFLAAAAGTVCLLMFFQHRPVENIALITGIGALVGYLVPDIILGFMIRSRQDAIAAGLPDALDFLVICVEAGLGLNSALVRVGKDLRIRCRELSDELLLVNHEMRTGANREQALKNLSTRNRVRYLNSMVSAIILSDRLGTNIADTLRAQSDYLRTYVRQTAEEKAAKASIYILFPLVVFILPSLFIIVLGPGFLSFMKEVAPLLK